MLDIQGYKDLYEQERLKVYNMDCMELLKQVPDKYFDLAIIDPPYGIGIVQQMEKIVASKSSMMKGSNGITGGHWDDAIPKKEYFDELKRISKNQIIWGGNYFLDYLGATRCFCIWDKMNGTNPMADAELAWASFERSVRMFRMHHFSAGYESKIHPTQKPVALYTWLLEKYAKPNFKIIDTHFGSGSHAIANHYYGSELIACELDTDYFKASIERIKKETRQLSFLQGGD